MKIAAKLSLERRLSQTLDSRGQTIDAKACVSLREPLFEIVFMDKVARFPSAIAFSSFIDASKQFYSDLSRMLSQAQAYDIAIDYTKEELAKLEQKSNPLRSPGADELFAETKHQIELERARRVLSREGSRDK